MSQIEAGCILRDVPLLVPVSRTAKAKKLNLIEGQIRSA